MHSMQEVRDDICHQLHLTNPYVSVSSVVRSNLHIHAQRKRGLEEDMAPLVEALRVKKEYAVVQGRACGR